MIRDTSLTAFITEQDTFTTQRSKVLLYILNNLNSYDLQISEGLEISINAVNGRRNQLLKDECIIEGTKVLSKTNKTVQTWVITSRGIKELGM